ncbi:enoyl-CoA hydratase/isomerase family protein [Sphingopyxis kveilinensis]|uniref:enoyl-CoA hydratase/isomerase family protein n=1 Tax=Sphingopyxis kveilinensis TaxID=3114367 RepID=UPI0030D4ACFF
MLRLERAGSVATIWLDNPARHNALDLRGAAELDRLTALCDDPAIDIIVLRARGTFCVGGDINEFHAERERIEAHILGITEHFHRAILRLATGRATSVAVVEGMAAGGGFALALACDIMIASTAARFVTAWSDLGFSPDGGASHFLTRRLGAARAFDLLVLDRPIDAQQAFDLGIATRLAAPDAIDDAVRQLVGEVGRKAADSRAAIKALVAAAATAPLADQLEAERRSIAGLAATLAARKRVEDFLNRRRAPLGS